MKFAKYVSLFGVMLFSLMQIGCFGGNATGTAEKFVEAKDYRRAVEVYQSIIDTKPDTAEARKAQLAIGKLYVKQMNQSAAGIKMYETLISDAPESEEAAEAHYRLGLHYYHDKKDFDNAQTQFDLIINKFPNLELSHNAQLMLAKSYEEAQNFEKAVEVFDNFAHRNPQSQRAAQALANKARIQRERLKNEEDAKRTYQFLVKKYGKNEEAKPEVEKAKQELHDLNASIPEPEDPEATQEGRAAARREARRELNKPRSGGERSRAVGGADTAVEDSGFGVSPEQLMQQFGGEGGISTDAEGTYYDAELMIAKFFFGNEEYQKAGALFYDGIARAKAEGAKIDPYNYLSLSICYRKIGLYQRAEKVLRKASSHDPRIIVAIINTGRNQYSEATGEEDYEKAIETYSSVLGFNRNKDSELHWLIGLAYKKLGNIEKEREHFERAIAADNTNADALQSLAETLNERVKDRKAAGIFKDLIDRRGDSYIGSKTLGDLCYKYGNYAQARVKYNAAARTAQRLLGKAKNKAEERVLTSQYVYSTIRTAQAAYKLGQEDAAQTAVDTLATEYPEHELIPYGKGELAALKGDETAAIAAFKESIEKNPKSDIAVIALGDFYISRGYNDDAIALWEGYLVQNKYNAAVRDRLKKLKSAN